MNSLDGMLTGVLAPYSALECVACQANVYDYLTTHDFVS